MKDSTEMAAQESANKHRIILHMNKDHTRELSYYLRHYARASTGAASSPKLYDIDFNGMQITASGGDYTIPFEPPLTSWAEVRGRVVEMANTARDALGLSDIVITTYTPPEGFGLVVVSSVLFYFLCAATLPWVGPESPVWPYLQAYFPGGPERYQWVVNVIFWPVIGIHVFECTIFEGKLKKHGVQRFTAVWFAWQLTTFVEGYTSFKRLDSVVAEIEEKKAKKN
ncbi:hypothetical protein BGZ63DRAFT_383163 [Mariannaea sp. PMI_226]|nr:hypothetical protein BGZ63DRAFT_383163 [Mariannaea sp. PMI_226]